MDHQLSLYTNGIELNPPATLELVKRVEQTLCVLFPKDYVDFMLSHNGGSGMVGNSYLNLWAIDELPDLNEGYSVNEFAKGLILFGTDGADTAYAFDTKSSHIQFVQVPFIGMDLDQVEICSDSFSGFLKYLYSSQ